MKSRLLILAGLALACGAPAEDEGEWVDTTVYDVPDVYVPGQEGRIDMTVWHDGAFNSPEAKEEFCAEHGDMPEAWFCSDLGTARQGWEVAEYHGLLAQGNQNATCYGSQSPSNGSGDCYLPKTTWMRVVASYGGCFAGQAPPNGPSTLQEQAILDGIRDGMFLWHNAGAGYGYNVPARVVANGSPGSSSYMPVTISCGNLDSPAYAAGGLTGLVSNITSNAPVGPNSGRDIDDLTKLPSGIMTVDIMEIFTRAGQYCGGGSNVTTTNLRNFAYSIGAHEMGHVFGFAHFNNSANISTNIMAPWRQNVCNSGVAFLSDYHQAIGFYQTDPSAGPSTVTDQGLWSEFPL